MCKKKRVCIKKKVDRQKEKRSCIPIKTYKSQSRTIVSSFAWGNVLVMRAFVGVKLASLPDVMSSASDFGFVVVGRLYVFTSQQ
jgi:hypothetical protein